MKEPQTKLSLELVDYVVPIRIDAYGQKVLLDETHYENGCIADLTKHSFTYFVFVRHVRLLVGKTGKARIESKREVREVSGKTHKKAMLAIDALIDTMDARVPALAEKITGWAPDNFFEALDAIRSGALKV